MTRRAQEPADLSALSGCAEELAQVFVSLSSDIALVIDDSGVITRVAQSPGAVIAPATDSWVGRPWVDTVTGDTRRKVELLLDDVATTGLARRREVNHAGVDAGFAIPVAYTAVRLGKDGPVIAAGRDLRAVAAIQQRFQDAQQELERTYWRARQAEWRHDLLVQVATDAVLVVDATTLLVVDADAAAVALLGHNEAVRGQPALQAFDAASQRLLRDLLVNARGSGRPAELQARLAGDSHVMVVTAAPFRARDGMRLLMRIRPLGATSGGDAATRRVLAWRAERLLEAVVVTDSAGRILGANAPFLRLIHVANEAELHGRSIADWVGRSAADLPALMKGVQDRGIAHIAGSLVRGGASSATVDIAVALLADGDQACFGFTLQRRPVPVLSLAAEDVAAGVRALTVELGHTPLPLLLQRAQRLVAHHLAEAALVRCAGDAADAAVLLGVTVAELADLQAERPGAGISPAAS